jgi:hypothetical protein
MMKDAVRYKQAIREKRKKVAGSNLKQKKANKYFNRFKNDLAGLASQCGLPQDTCAASCNAIKVEDREV